MDDRPTLTHCPYCSLQCGITLRVAPDRVHLAPQEDFPTNRGGLCSKGWTAAELIDHPERLTVPLVRNRRGAPLKPTTWDDALDRIVYSISSSQRRHGRASVGCFGGGGGPALAVGGIRRAYPGRRRARGQQDGGGVAAEDDLGRAVHRRARRPVHQ
ncbi:MAG: hypothetical protein ACRDTJ_18240, partial [Pseudonocardiaceae bacterium]